MLDATKDAALISRLLNWKFSQARDILDSDGHSVATEDADIIKALDRLLGDSGWFGGDFGSIIGIAIDSLLPEEEK